MKEDGRGGRVEVLLFVDNVLELHLLGAPTAAGARSPNDRSNRSRRIESNRDQRRSRPSLALREKLPQRLRLGRFQPPALDRLLRPRGGPFGGRLSAHEFHYATTLRAEGPALFDAADAEGTALPPLGLRHGRVSGSFAHIIDRAD